jgi:hypothetical protein
MSGLFVMCIDYLLTEINISRQKEVLEVDGIFFAPGPID